jgi:hypothetical protein
MRSTFLALVLSSLAVSAAVGCSANASDDEAAATAGADLSASDRAALMDGLRAKVKPTIANQDIVFNVQGQGGVLRVDGNFGWLQGQVQLRNGGVPTTKGTIYEEAAKEGIFDGYRIEALMQRSGNGWKVVEYAIGSTDVWWDRIDERYPAAPKTIFPWRDGDSERPAIMDTLRAKEQPELAGQDIVYNVKGQGGSFRVSGDWCWLQGQIELRGGGAPKDEGIWAGGDGWHVEALLHKVNGQWTVVRDGVGSTDVWWDGIWDEFPAAPRSIFPALDGK